MSIELQCPQCQKLIRAPDDAGGRRGKCPYCQNELYIPTPPDENEAIGIAPLDEEEERRAAQLHREAAESAAAFDHVTDLGGEPAEAPAGTVVDLADEVESFVRAMHESRLDAAEASVAKLKTAAARARDYVQGLMVDDMPGRFENIPPPLVQGFLKALLARLT